MITASVSAQPDQIQGQVLGRDLERKVLARELADPSCTCTCHEHEHEHEQRVG
jgi:hypothetical protein